MRFLSLLLILSICLLSCSKSVYVLNEGDTQAKFTLYGKNYKYEEKSPSGSYSFWGQYEIKDSIISMEIYDKSRLPYGYMGGAVRVVSDQRGEYASWQIVHMDSAKPMPFVSVIFYDEKMHWITGIESDREGHVSITDTQKVKFVKIEYVASLPLVFDISDYRSKDLIVEIEDYRPAGPWKGDCLIYQEGAVLEYIIDDPNNPSSISRYELVFRKSK